MAAESLCVMLACPVLRVLESGYYAQHGRPPSARALHHRGLTELIRRVARPRRRARPALLILDDFAMREFSAGQADDLYELIAEGAGRSLVITANWAVTDWYLLFPNPVVAESILDRLVNSAHHVHMDGRSYRPNRRPAPEPAA